MNGEVISRYPKFLPANGKIPSQAQFTCKTCNEWFASQTGRVNHGKKNPDHVLINLKTGLPIGSTPRWRNRLGIRPTNGHSTEIPPALLEYAFEKMRSTIESELDRLHDQLIQPTTAKPTSGRKFYVAR
jgi:hypothetical protein